jgi:hypothetical protein
MRLAARIFVTRSWWETMTTAEMATYAYVQIDQARAELKAVTK